jgi:hypothetical protein
MSNIGRLLPVFIAVIVLQPTAMAEDAVPASQPETAGDDEELLDEGLKRFGYLAGLARGCVVEDQRPALEREALDLSASIGRLLGTDRAFLFASSFGYGTTITVDAEECAEVLEAYDARVESYRTSRGAIR